MPDFKKSGNSQNTRLVFAITQHPSIGWMIDPFAVNITQKGQFEYGFKKVSKTTYWDYFDQLPANETKLIEILEKYSDENLQKRFNTKKLRTTAFYDSLEPEFVGNHIRPFIDKVLYEAANFMIQNGLHLHFKGESTERIIEKPLIFTDGFAESCFIFEKQDTYTQYKLQIRYQQEDILLYNRGAILVSEKPCLLLIEKRIFRFETQWEGKKLVPFFQKEFLQVPASSEKQFYKKFVEKTIRQYPFIARGFEVRTNNELPLPVLQMENHWQGNIALGLYFRYPKGVTFLPDDPANSYAKLVESDNSFSFDLVSRNRELEKKITDFLLSNGLKKLDSVFYVLEQDIAIAMAEDSDSLILQAHLYVDWMNQHLDEMTSLGIKLEKISSGRYYFTGKMEISLGVDEKTDWFDLYGIVKFGTFEIPFTDLRANILAGNREFVLPDGTIALIPAEWLTKYHDIVRFGHKKGDRIELKKHHYTLFDSIHDTGFKIKSGAYLHFGENDFQLPNLLHAQLRPYQQTGYNWMMHLKENKLGGCLADDMGLGKTLQALALLTQVHLIETSNNITGNPRNDEISGKSIQMDLFESITESKRPVSGNCSLIIMPLSLIHNWMQEASRFSPELRVFRYAGSSRKLGALSFNDHDVVLTTYGTVRNDIDLLKEHHFRYIILDESQIIKNAKSKIFSTIKRLLCEHRLVLTGTPVENSLTDLWSQFSFINPGMLGSLKFFREEYVLPVEKKQDKSKGEKLQKLIQPFILRRTKDQVAKELPPLTEKIHYCEMTSEQENYYESKKSEIRNSIIQNLETLGVDKSRFMILSGLTRLRLIANHPVIVDKDYGFQSGKYIEVIRNIDKLLSENHKVLVFSQFVKHLNLFADHFQKHSLQYSLLTGKIAEKDRKQVIHDFQTEELRQLFLISLRAGGLGLNLTEADYVFMLDPWWNPAIEKQAINRAHRIGQDKKVFVYKFITRNTVEEKILKLQQRKSNLAGMFINDNNPLKSLSFEELNELI